MLRIPVESYSRSVGYFRPLAQMNLGIRAQVKDRHLHFQKDIKKILDLKNKKQQNEVIK